MKLTHILITGPIFNTPSGPSGQGGRLYTKLKQAGYTVYKRSFYKNRLLRILDTIGFLLLKPHKYQVVLVQMFLLRAFIMEDIILRISLLLGKKYIAVIRGGAFVEFYEKNEKWCNKVLSKIHLITTPSLFITHFLQQKGYRVMHIPNFIDLTYFPFQWQNTQQKKLLWVRSFQDIYKPELAIQAMKVLVKKYPDITLTMVGPDQGKLEYCKQLITALELDKHIIITGVIPNNELNKVYSSHQIFITTTSYESFGVALMEAAASGIPMVSTNVGEIPHIWTDKEDMLIVKDNDVEAFSNAIISLIENQELRQKLSKNARKKAEQYTWESIKPKWESILE